MVDLIVRFDGSMFLALIEVSDGRAGKRVELFRGERYPTHTEAAKAVNKAWSKATTQYIRDYQQSPTMFMIQHVGG